MIFLMTIYFSKYVNTAQNGIYSGYDITTLTVSAKMRPVLSISSLLISLINSSVIYCQIYL